MVFFLCEAFFAWLTCHAFLGAKSIYLTFPPGSSSLLHELTWVVSHVLLALHVHEESQQPAAINFQQYLKLSSRSLYFRLEAMSFAVLRL